MTGRCTEIKKQALRLTRDNVVSRQVWASFSRDEFRTEIVRHLRPDGASPLLTVERNP